MKDRLHDVLTRARSRYADLRLRRVWSTSVLVRNRIVETSGTGVRSGGVARAVSPDTGWGTVGFTGMDRLPARIALADDLAAAGSGTGTELAPIPVRQLELTTLPTGDPRETPLAAKRQLATDLSELIHSLDRRISESRVLYRDEVVETWLATSEEGWLHEIRPESTLSAIVWTQEGGNVERAIGSVSVRGAPSGLAGAAETLRGVALRAIDRLHTPPVRPDRYTVVLDPAAAGALIHRVVSHLGRTALPGADPDALPIGLRVGPEFLTIGDDPTADGLRGTAAADDEGTPTRRAIIIQNGVVTGHLTTRETAARTRLSPTGHARSGSILDPPVPRPANTFLAQGQGTLDDLLEGVSAGVYVADVLACEEGAGQLMMRAAAGRMIRGGRLAEPVKGVQLEGSLLGLLGRIDAVAGDFTWDSSAAHCRDGAHGVVPVSTGAPHVRLVDVAVTGGIS